MHVWNLWGSAPLTRLTTTALELELEHKQTEKEQKTVKQKHNKKEHKRTEKKVSQKDKIEQKDTEEHKLEDTGEQGGRPSLVEHIRGLKRTEM